jgi:AGCS family alanine or glycine:cation symporter
MAEMVGQLNEFLSNINGYLWHDYVLFTLLGVGVLFTLWTGFTQWHALTHGIQVIRGKYDRKDDPGAINHFQALSAALSATVGLGNIGGVAIAVALGGPGAVFWMWVVGFVGMALKATEVTQSMFYRNTSESDNPHGGPMWVAKLGIAKMNPSLKGVGTTIGGIFCITLLIATFTGGNMFQAWNVGELTKTYYNVPQMLTGIILAIVVGMVILGGIKRIGAVAGRLVPFMCALYILSACYVLVINYEMIPDMFALIFSSAFSPTEAQGAFLGGSFGMAFMWGMKRALFSNEAGQGSAPIAHAAAKTDEPVREGIVAGIGPFIDTLIVCTLTALVILSSGAWNREPEALLKEDVQFTQVEPGKWALDSMELPERDPEAVKISGEWKEGDGVFVNITDGESLYRLNGDVVDLTSETGQNMLGIEWGTVDMALKPELTEPGLYADYVAAGLTSSAFDRVDPGLGGILVPLAAWLFAISTMISWSYYGEQGVVYLFGSRGVVPYKVVYCFLILMATSGFVKTDTELANLTDFGTGMMLLANVPIMLIFGPMAMRKYKDYMARLRSGKMKGHGMPNITDVVEGKDVE